MLIHDIYQRNVEEGRILPPKSSRPFKIVYATGKIEADDRPFEAFFGATASEETEGPLFKYLGMPLSTASTVPPLAIVGANEKRPYVEFWGVILIEEEAVTVTIGDKIAAGNKIPNPLATVSLGATGETDRKHYCEEKTVQRRVLSGYGAGGKSLEDAYDESAMFGGNGDLVLTKGRVKEVCDALFDQMAPKLQKYVFESGEEDTGEKRKRKSQSMSFKVFVLPTRDKIGWDIAGRPSDEFVDVFGNVSTERAPNKATFNSKFLSTDDPSFTVKCRKDISDVYDDLNLSKESYLRINLHNEDLFSLSGLFWYFGTNEDAKNRKRQPREDESEEQPVRRSGIKKHGFYAQIRDMAEAEWGDHRIMCIKRDNAKVEILLDEYCPISAIRKRLLEDGEGRLRYSPMALESLILDKDWSLYMDAVRALIHGRKVARHRIVARLTAIMRKKMRGSASARDIAGIFSPGLFCLEAIARGGDGRLAGLEDDERFAYCVGQAAMRFARLRSGKSPTRDALLKRPAYDRAVLRGVLSKVVSGLALRLDDPKAAATLAGCAHALSQAGGHEIPDRGSRADLSYFFYAGAFSVIGNGGKAKGVEEGAGAG